MEDDIVGGPIFGSSDENSGMITRYLRELVELVKTEGSDSIITELVEQSDALHRLRGTEPHSVSLDVLKEVGDEKIIELLNDIISTSEFAPDKNILLASMKDGTMLAVCINASPSKAGQLALTTEFKEIDLSITLNENIPSVVRSSIVKTTLDILADGKNCAIAWKACEHFCGVSFSDIDDVKVEVIKVEL